MKRNTGKTSRSAWKNVERKTAKLFGTDRVPLSGAAKSLKTSSDTLHEHLYLECKNKMYHNSSLLFNTYFQVHKRSFVLKRTKVRDSKKRAFKKVYTDKKAHLVLLRLKGTRGFLICFHNKDFATVVTKYSWPINTNVFHYATLVREKMSIVTLYIDSAEKAEIENKIPLVVVKRKYERGEYYITSPKYLQKIAEFYGKKGTGSIES